MRLLFFLTISLIILKNLAQDLKLTTKVEETNTDSTDEEDVVHVVTTEQVLDPKIKLVNSAEIDEDEEEVDESWDKNLAILDVAYLLRAHKFTDYDRRYFAKISDSPRRHYQEFPKPRLKALHWEVHKECEAGFVHCLKYLQRISKLTALRREDDTATVMWEHTWSETNNSEQILIAQKDCQMAQVRDEINPVPFQGPIERFQWRTSASYYMCWFTMLGTPELTYFGQPCDNHADCLGIYGANNKDPRADDKNPFACALYSFCPDPCCPIKHIRSWKDCFQTQENPCYDGNPPANRKCALKREQNQDFESLIKNEVNISCECRVSGYEWSSRFGLCVDVNECDRESHSCSLKSGQTCFNLPGHFDCVCRIGYIYNPREKRCLSSYSLENILQQFPTVQKNDTKHKSIFALVAKIFSKSSGSIFTLNSLFFLEFILLI